MHKEFTQWNNLKAELNQRERFPVVKQREVWWCSIGINVGHEEDGKSGRYSRPVLVIRKFNRHIFLGVPLTTQVKDKPYFYRIHFEEREQSVLLSQIRLWDSKRLTTKIGQLPRSQFDAIRAALKDII